VNKGYKDIVKKNINRCKLIDSSKSKDDTKEQVIFYLESFIQEFANTNKKKVKPN
jgi:thymidylate kinase